MRGFNPKGARRAKKFANGGMVRGPGTGTSDDIETEVPEGSYIMPADTTATLGPQALAGMGGARGFPARGNPVPVNLSNGEYKMPPKQVHAVGKRSIKSRTPRIHRPPQKPRAGFNQWSPASRACSLRAAALPRATNWRRRGSRRLPHGRRTSRSSRAT